MSTCDTCKWWQGSSDIGKLGKCRRYPPGSTPGEVYDFFPVVQSEDWCGEHSPRAAPVAEKENAKLFKKKESGAESRNLSLHEEEVEWVVNNLGELGVKVGTQFFFLYKGHSLNYGKHMVPCTENGKVMQWRYVLKREFGECCHPINYEDPSRVGTVNVNDGRTWHELPPDDTQVDYSCTRNDPEED